MNTKLFNNSHVYRNKIASSIYQQLHKNETDTFNLKCTKSHTVTVNRLNTDLLIFSIFADSLSEKLTSVKLARKIYDIN
ncbi:hypothetical protein T01_6893 [Trichinella spiralis]|uniref:Uncharacterized protein n=1 Tax=Trichinella spiralis TaxID=6334 RepID=A0A0V1BM23_TRISP|nr:hypothetical protein T01_6893 [Trichinella spiralis]